MKLYVFNSDCFVYGAEGKEYQAISDILAFEVPNWTFIQARNPKLANWDGKKRFYDKKNNSFPTGFLPFLLEKLRKRKIVCTLSDERDPIPELVRPDILHVKRWHALLREQGFDPNLEKSNYQVKGVREALQGRVGNLPWPRGLISYPTGSGKTLLTALLTMVTGQKTLFLVERLDLLAQTREVFEKVANMPVGRISDGDFEPEHCTISTIQTIVRKLGKSKVDKYLQSIGMVIFDECQNLSGSKGEFRDRYLLLLAALQNASRRFGVSATCLMRGDLGDAYLMGAFGSIIADVSASTYIEKGLLAKPNIKMIRIDEPEVPFGVRGAGIYEHGIVTNIDRNQMIVEMSLRAVRSGLPTFVLVRLAKHGNLLRKMFSMEGVEAKFLNYRVKSKDRRQEVQNFDSGKVNILIASSIFDVGINVERLRFLMVAPGGRSAIKTIQRLGRPLRPKKEGDNTVTIVDFYDRTHPNLEDSSRERFQAYKSEGHNVEIVVKR
jgi:superfamily II DNA or RNA helicase